MIEQNKMRLTYEQDLFPGEFFGEVALDGLHHRAVTVQALTDLELICVDYEDYLDAKGRTMHLHNALPVEDKYSFLKELPLFKHCDKYSLSRFAHKLTFAEVGKGARVMTKNEAMTSLYFE